MVPAWDGAPQVRVLLLGGAAVDLQDHEGASALQLACRYGHEDTVRSLHRPAGMLSAC